MDKRKKNKRATLYLDGKRVYQKDLRVKGLQGRIRRLKSLCFLPDMSVTEDCALSNGKTLKIVVSSKDKKK